MEADLEERGGTAAVSGRAWAIGFVLLLIAFAARVVTLGQPLVETHAFRQTQTAYTALIYHRAGIDLLSTPLPVFGPNSVVPFEFPLFQGIAALVMDAGVAVEPALRVTSLAFFIVSLVLVWAITRYEIDPTAALVAAVGFALAPLGLLWSRTSMIETIAVAATLAAVYAALRWDRTGSMTALLLAVLLASLAALLKVTTAAIWLAPAPFLLRRSRIGGLAILGVSMAIGLAWTIHTDAIKAALPATEFLTSANLREWNFGTLQQRLDPATWVTLAGWLAGLGAVVVLAPFVVRRSRIGGWALATLILGPLIFTNLYVVHDYYWMAVAPAVAILIGLIFTRVADTGPARSRRVRWLSLSALFAVSYFLYPRWLLMYRESDEVHALSRAAQIRAATNPSDLIRISQGSWSPAILFYADRRGYMDDPHIPVGPADYVHFVCPDPATPGPCVRE